MAYLKSEIGRCCGLCCSGTEMGVLEEKEKKMNFLKQSFKAVEGPEAVPWVGPHQYHGWG